MDTSLLNLLPLRACVSSELTFSSLLQQIREVTLGAISNASSNSRHYSAGELVSTYSAALPRVDVDHAYHLDPDDRANSGLPSPVRPL